MVMFGIQKLSHMLKNDWHESSNSIMVTKKKNSFLHGFTL
jgi:hypothetical protein